MNEISVVADASINDEIRQMVEREWDEHGKALLLARLGQALTRKGYDLRAWHKGKGFATAIEKQMGNEFKILVSPTDNLVRAVVPKSAKLGEDLNKYFLQAAEKAPLPHIEKIRFNHRLWIAFSRPLPQNLARYFLFEGEMDFIEVRTSESSQGVRIPAEKIVSSTLDKDERDKQIEQNIISWLHQNNITPSTVKAESAEKSVKAEQYESVFNVLVESLDAQDLRRISMPLDVILKLQRKNSKTK